MSRYAKANQTIDDLKALIQKTAICESDDGQLTTYCDDDDDDDDDDPDNPLLQFDSDKLRVDVAGRIEVK